jgi:hypothetical protein
MTDYKTKGMETARVAGRFLRNYGDLAAIVGLQLTAPAMRDWATGFDAELIPKGGQNGSHAFHGFYQMYMNVEPYITCALPQLAGAVTEFTTSYRNARENHGVANSIARGLESVVYRATRNQAVYNAAYISGGHDHITRDHYTDTCATVAVAFEGLRYAKPFTRLASGISKGIKKLKRDHDSSPKD